MRNTLLLLLGLGFLANGVFMFFAPQPWYETIPGVTGTGPFNLHFIRDIGCAYATCGLAAIWAARDPRAWPAAVAAGIFLSLHAALHVYEALVREVAIGHLVSDALLVVAPAVLTLWLALSNRRSF